MNKDHIIIPKQSLANETHEAIEREIHNKYPDSEQGSKSDSSLSEGHEGNDNTSPPEPTPKVLVVVAEVDNPVNAFLENAVELVNEVWAKTHGQCHVVLVIPKSDLVIVPTKDDLSDSPVSYDKDRRILTCPGTIFLAPYTPGANQGDDESCVFYVNAFFASINDHDRVIVALIGHGTTDGDLCRESGKMETVVLTQKYLVKKLKSLTENTTVVLFRDHCHTNSEDFHVALRKMQARVLVLNCADKVGLSWGTCITKVTFPMILEWLQVRDVEAKCARVLEKYLYRDLDAVLNKESNPPQYEFVCLNLLDNRYYRAVVNGVDKVIFFRTGGFLQERLAGGVTVIAIDCRVVKFLNCDATRPDGMAAMTVIDIPDLDERTWDTVRIVENLLMLDYGEFVNRGDVDVN